MIKGASTKVALVAINSPSVFRLNGEPVSAAGSGGALAARSGRGNWLAIKAENARRIDGYQRYFCAGALDHTLAGLTASVGVAPGSFLASWRFDCVLRRAAGHQPVSRSEKCECCSYAQHGYGFRCEWHGHFGSTGKICLCQPGLRGVAHN